MLMRQSPVTVVATAANTAPAYAAAPVDAPAHATATAHAAAHATATPPLRHLYHSHHLY